MSPDFLRKTGSREEEEKRKLVAAALRGMSMQLETPEPSARGKLLSFPGSADRCERMIGLLADTTNPNRAQRAASFLGYWRDLAAEMRAARNARREAMAAGGNWDFPDLIRNDLEFLRILAGLRWMVLRYRLGFVPDCLALSALVQEGVAFAAAS